MAQSDEIVSRIVEAVARYGGQLPPDIDDLVADYIAQVEEVNRRLDRCVRLLRSGRRTEAIHEAEIAPPVLDDAVALDFPQRSIWEDLCQQHGLGPIPSLNSELAIELDEAFPREQALAKLLERHRLLALARAPLVLRIRTLRRIAAADPQNAIWSEDLLELERARHKQIIEESRTLAAAGDLNRLLELHGECAETWLEPPPAGVREGLTRHIKQLRARKLQHKLESVKKSLAEAFGQKDPAQTRSHLDTCQQIANQLKMDLNSDAGVAAAAQWIAQIEQEQQLKSDLQRAITSVEQALDEMLNQEELERRWATLVRLEQPIPSRLQTRYDHAQAGFQLEASRRFRIRVLIVAASIAVIAGGLIVLIHNRMTHRAIEQWRQQLAGALEGHRLSEAEQLVEQIRQLPAVWDDPRIQSLALRLEDAATQERQRQERFEAALQQVVRVGMAQPDRAALERALTLAHTPDEKRRAEQLRDQIEADDLAAQQKRDESFNEALVGLQQRYAQLRHDTNLEDTERLEAAMALRTEIGRLMTLKDISSPLLTAAESLHSSIQSIVTMLEQREQRRHASQQALTGLYRPGTSLEQLSQNIDRFLEAFGDDAHAGDLRQAGDLVRMSDPIRQWETLVGRLDPLRVDDVVVARRRLATINEYLQAHQVTPYRQAAEQYAQYLERAINGLTDETRVASPHGELVSALSHPAMSKLLAVPLTNGRYLYVRQNRWLQQIDGSRLLVQHATNVEQAMGVQTPHEQWLPRSLFPDVNAIPQPASHAAFASAALARLSQPHQWETICLELCHDLMVQQDVPPLLKVMLAEKLVSLACRQGWPRHEALDAWWAQLREVPTDLSWLDPLVDHPEHRRRTALAVTALEAMPDLTSLDRSHREQWRTLHEAMKPRRIAGMFHRTAQGPAWLGREPSLPSGRLEGLVVSNNEPEFVVLGRVANGYPYFLDDIVDYPTGGIVYYVADQASP